MAQKLDIVQTKDSLVALLTATVPVAFAMPVDVRESGKSDFDDRGQLILPKVAIRVRFGEATFGETRDISKTTLSAALQYQVICRYESLRGKAEMRDRSLELAACAMDILAGARLALDNGSTSDPIAVRAVLPVSDQYGPVEDCFGITIEISGFSQFPGTYAVPMEVAA